MRISKKDVERVAHLARLELSEEEKGTFTNHLDSILSFAEKINELNTEEIEPTSHVLEITNVTREDTVKPSLPVEEALRNTADHEKQQVKVPSVLEG